MHLRIGTIGKILGLFVLCSTLVLIGLKTLAPALHAHAAYTPDMYQIHTDKTIWQYNGGGFHSWTLLDNNPNTSYIVARGTDLYQVHTDHSIWQYNGGGFHSWTLLDDNPATDEIAAGGNGHLYQLRGVSIWQYNGGGFHSWTQVDTYPTSSTPVYIVAGGNYLYKLLNDRNLWQYNGSSWIHLDDNPNIVQLEASESGDLYQKHLDGSLWKYNGGGFHSWTLLDTNPDTYDIRASGNTFYQTHAWGIWQWKSGRNWTQLDDNSATVEIAPGVNGDLYQRHRDGSVWQYAGGGLHSWTLLDNNPVTAALAKPQVYIS